MLTNNEPWLLCDQCVSTHKVVEAGDGETTCETHPLSNCAHAIHLDAMAGGPPTSECVECDDGYFIDNGECTVNPNDVTGCDEYYLN